MLNSVIVDYSVSETQTTKVIFLSDYTSIHFSDDTESTRVSYIVRLNLVRPNTSRGHLYTTIGLLQFTTLDCPLEPDMVTKQTGG